MGEETTQIQWKKRKEGESDEKKIKIGRKRKGNGRNAKKNERTNVTKRKRKILPLISANHSMQIYITLRGQDDTGDYFAHFAHVKTLMQRQSINETGEITGEVDEGGGEWIWVPVMDEVKKSLKSCEGAWRKRKKKKRRGDRKRWLRLDEGNEDEITRERRYTKKYDIRREKRRGERDGELDEGGGER